MQVGILWALLDGLEKAYAKDTDSPTWDGSGALRHTFYKQSLKCIPTKDSAYDSIRTDGSVLIGRHVCVSSLDHAITYGKLNNPDEGHVEYVPFAM